MCNRKLSQRSGGGLWKLVLGTACSCGETNRDAREAEEFLLWSKMDRRAKWHRQVSWLSKRRSERLALQSFLLPFLYCSKHICVLYIATLENPHRLWIFFFTFSFWVLILVICDLCQPLLVTSRDYNTTKSIAPLTHPHILQCVLLLTQVLIYLLIVCYMNCQKIVKTKKKQDHQNIKKPHVMSLNIFFWLSRTPKTLNILSSNTKKSRKSSHFCLKNDFNNELTNCFRSKSVFLFVFVVILCKKN